MHIILFVVIFGFRYYLILQVYIKYQCPMIYK